MDPPSTPCVVPSEWLSPSPGPCTQPFLHTQPPPLLRAPPWRREDRAASFPGGLALEHWFWTEKLWELVQGGNHYSVTQDGGEQAALSPRVEGALCSKPHLDGRTVLNREAMGEGLPWGVGSVTHFCGVPGFCKIPQITCPPAGSGPAVGEAHPRPP